MSCSSIRLYRSNISRVECPVIRMMTDSATPAFRMYVLKQWRRSWNTKLSCTVPPVIYSGSLASLLESGPDIPDRFPFVKKHMVIVHRSGNGPKDVEKL